MTYKIDTWRFLAKCATLLGQGKDQLTQCQDNVTEQGIGLWCWWPDFPALMSQVGVRPDMTLDVART